MLKRIELKGFQAHKHSVFDFTSGSNLILGDNGSGKSAMRRGLTWVMTNKPTGASFASKVNWEWEDSTPCEVTVEYNEHIVTRRRSRNSKVNEYIVDGEKLTTFGTDVPSEVAEIFKLDDTNLEEQKSPYFLLSENAPTIARRLNKLTNLESIDKAFAIIRSKKQDTSKEVKNTKAALEDLEASIKSYEYLESAEHIADSLESSIQAYNALDAECTDISILVSGLEQAQKEVKSPCIVDANMCSQLVSSFNEIDTFYTTLYSDLYALASVKTLSKSPVEVSSIISTLNTINALQSDYSILESELQVIEGTVIGAEAPKLKISEALSSLTAINNEQRELESLINSIEQATKIHLTLDAECVTLRKELDAMWPDVCPLCGSLIGDKTCTQHST